MIASASAFVPGAGILSNAIGKASAAAFVCEEDVRQALALGRTILIDDRTIVTPLARDLGEARKVLITAGLAR